MPRTPPKRAIPLFLALITVPAVTQAEDTPLTTATADDTATPSGDLRRYAVRSGGGCVAGAIAGTIVPGLGNAVGCAIGAFGGWLFTWMQEPEDLFDDE